MRRRLWYCRWRSHRTAGSLRRSPNHRVRSRDPRRCAMLPHSPGNTGWAARQRRRSVRGPRWSCPAARTGHHWWKSWQDRPDRPAKSPCTAHRSGCCTKSGRWFPLRWQRPAPPSRLGCHCRRKGGTPRRPRRGRRWCRPSPAPPPSCSAGSRYPSRNRPAPPGGRSS